MDTHWPQWLIKSFVSANQPQFANVETAYYGPYMRLLYHLFGLEGPFKITPQYEIHEKDRDLIDVIASFTVELDEHPVLFIEVKAPAPIALDSRRKQADDEMRDRFLDLHLNVVAPRLHGISVFGTRMAFYEYVAATKELTPHRISLDPVFLNDLAPAEQWSYDLLEANGIAKMCEVVEDVKSNTQIMTPLVISSLHVHDAMDTPWPQWLINPFVSANQHRADESIYYGPYTQLLYYLFDLEGPFEISPQYYFPPTSRYDYDVVALFTVELDKHPVFFIEVKRAANFARKYDRKLADNQMRVHFRDPRHNLVTPRLPGISAFGTRMAFYEYVAATNTLTPSAISTNPDYILSDYEAPVERWGYDLLEADGIAKMREVAEDVKAMCQARNK